MGVMGCLPSKSEQERQADEASKKIDRRLKQEAASSSKKVKLLLLGPAESGKSTVAKQLRILHQNGFSDQDRKEYRILVHTHVLKAMITMVKAMEQLQICYRSNGRAEDAEKVVAAGKFEGETLERPLDEDIFQALNRLWNDGGIQSCYERSREYQLSDSVKYFFDDLDRISRHDYVPSEQDILRTRQRSTGIVETTFQYKNLDFTLIDVAGHRSERRKWIHCFEDVTAIIYCVAMSEYDQLLVEDNETNRMVESLKLFDSICNNSYFVNTAFILFLNKTDLFREKVQSSKISEHFPSFKGRDTYEEGSMFIRKMFEEVNTKKTREIYTHFTCATDTENVRFVFNAVSDVISSKIINAIFGPN